MKCSCGKKPSFGFNNNKPTCCSNCKEEGMIDLRHPKCLCGKRASYGYINNKRPTKCFNYKLEKMINIASKKCKCGEHQPTFGYTKAVCCSSCKEEGMINLKHKHCKCGKRPSFGLPGKNPTHCKDCKEKEMIDVVHVKCKCGKNPSYGYEKPTHCKDCRDHDMNDIINPRCKSEFCDIFIYGKNKKYDGYCTHCFANLFPQDPRTTLIKKKSKELKVVSFIGQRQKEWVHDKPLWIDIKGGCCNSKRRIDLRKLVNNTMLCIEVDENQHKYYNKKDEEERYDNLFMDWSGKWIFIRYNPDKYKHNSKTKNPRFETRMNILLTEIEKQIKRISNDENKELVEIIYLYYDSS